MRKIFFTFMVLASILSAKCREDHSQLLKIVKDTCYKCMFPLKVGGITVANSPDELKDNIDMPSGPVCTCPAPPPLFVRPGIPVGFNEPSRIIDVVQDANCYVGLGFQVNINAIDGTAKSTSDRRRASFYQAHYYIFPLYSILELMTDFICFESASFDVAWITEIDPFWTDDSLAALQYPEGILFGNPVANMACVADSVASNLEKSLDMLFWCKGSWGSAYPMTGYVGTKNMAEDSASVAANLIYLLHRRLILWGTWGEAGMCSKFPSPIWQKSAYHLQIMAPVAHGRSVSIGEAGLKWDYVKNPMWKGDNFSYLLFKQRSCCAF